MDKKLISYYIRPDEGDTAIDIVWDLVGIIADSEITVQVARDKFRHATRNLVRVAGYDMSVTALSEDRILAIKFIELLIAFSKSKGHNGVNDTDIVINDIASFLTPYEISSSEDTGMGVVQISQEEISMMKGILEIAE